MNTAPASTRRTFLNERLMKIVVAAGYSGYIGIEYEGQKHSEIDGIKRTKQALEEIRTLL